MDGNPDQAVEIVPLLCSVAHLVRMAQGHRAWVEVNADARCPPCRSDPQVVESALVDVALWAVQSDPRGLVLSARDGTRAGGSPMVELTVAPVGAQKPDLALWRLSSLRERLRARMDVALHVGDGNSVSLYVPQSEPGA